MIDILLLILKIIFGTAGALMMLVAIIWIIGIFFGSDSN